LSIETLFVVNECEIFYENNIISNLIFNIYFDIELSFPTNKSKEYLSKYHLQDLFEFKYNSNTSNKGPIKNDKAKLCRLPKILIISIIRTVINKDLIKSILHFPLNLNEQKNT
jgi:hypothetical protein